ncbi:MAG: hypothetical protein IT162_04020, partial [Bryobacterales bacterium]|nr:hypothetical protein [Bryobacterales bacterium]
MRHAVAAAALLFARSLHAESVTVNWATRTIDCPSEVEYDRRLSIRVIKINDLVYNYDIEASARRSWADDFAQMKDLFKFEAAATGTCPDLKKAKEKVAAVAAALEKATKPTQNQSGKYESIALETTIAAWNKIEAGDEFKEATDALKKLEDQTDCQGAELEKVRDDWRKILAFGEKVRGPHEWQGTIGITMGANHDVSVKVDELFRNSITEKGSQDFKCEVKSALMSLSAGPLFSSLSNRKYAVVDIPKLDPATGLTLNETYKGLAVENAKPSALAATALFNFALPKLSGAGLSVHATSGPVLRQSSSGSSSFGYFAGFSLAIAKRLFITYGVQRSQFADFPVGYSQNSFVPASI